MDATFEKWRRQKYYINIDVYWEKCYEKAK